jgi:hypothetical protein
LQGVLTISQVSSWRELADAARLDKKLDLDPSAALPPHRDEYSSQDDRAFISNYHLWLKLQAYASQ